MIGKHEKELTIKEKFILRATAKLKICSICRRVATTGKKFSSIWVCSNCTNGTKER